MSLVRTFTLMILTTLALSAPAYTPQDVSKSS